jgi:hypothetical protein
MLSVLLILTASVPQGKGTHCFACHASVDSIKKYAVEEPPPSEEKKVESCGGAPPVLKKYQKLRVSSDFLASTMGQQGCIKCHGGQDIAGMDAHEGVIADPSETPDGKVVCAACHDTIAQHYETALHFTAMGQEHALEARAGQEGVARGDGCLAGMYENDCKKCHASCGDCHVSRPKPVKGGLLSFHQFMKTPPMEVCKACHAARTAGEYLGNFNYPADVHWTKGLMECVACHKGPEMHGDGVAYDNMHLSPGGPRCDSCHAGVLSKGEQHKIHGKNVSCWVCHAVATKNCFTCHEGYDEAGDFYRRADDIKMMFKIGYNYYQDKDHPWKYTTVRHPPTCPDCFEYFCSGLFDEDFSSLPTWKPVSAHTIQRITPQNEKCENCHGNPDVFLAGADLMGYERQANASVVNAQETVFPVQSFSWKKWISIILLPLFVLGLAGHGLLVWVARALARRRERKTREE